MLIVLIIITLFILLYTVNEHFSDESEYCNKNCNDTGNMFSPDCIKKCHLKSDNCNDTIKKFIQSHQKQDDPPLSQDDPPLSQDNYPQMQYIMESILKLADKHLTTNANQKTNYDHFNSKTDSI